MSKDFHYTDELDLSAPMYTEEDLLSVDPFYLMIDEKTGTIFVKYQGRVWWNTREGMKQELAWRTVEP